MGEKVTDVDDKEFEQEMKISSVELSKHHPYVKNFHTSVFKCRDRWIVKWRSFDSTMNDQDWPTLEDANNHAKKLKDNCHILINYYVDGGEGFEQHNKFWCEK